MLLFVEIKTMSFLYLEAPRPKELILSFYKFADD
jgi:hypothetical protein